MPRVKDKDVIIEVISGENLIFAGRCWLVDIICRDWHPTFMTRFLLIDDVKRSGNVVFTPITPRLATMPFIMPNPIKFYKGLYVWLIPQSTVIVKYVIDI